MGYSSGFIIGALLLIPGMALSQEPGCPEGTLKRQFDERISSVQVVEAMGSDPAPFLAALYMVEFGESSIFATNYPCTISRQATFDPFVAYAWVVEIPSDANFSVVPIHDVTTRALTELGTKVERIGDTILFLDSGDELYLSSSIDFLVQNSELLGLEFEPKLIVSGPFFRPTEDGEEAIGFLNSSAIGKLGTYKNFSARHILCVNDDGIDLLERDWLAARIGMMGADESVLDTAIDRMATEECSDGFQAGPAFWERPRSAESLARPGISGLSRREAQRNVIFRIGRGEDRRDFVVSTISSISSFDTMVLIAAIGGAIDGELPVEWAIGLQDEDFLGGPLLKNSSAETRIAPTHRPTGAVLLVE